MWNSTLARSGSTDLALPWGPKGRPLPIQNVVAVHPGPRPANESSAAMYLVELRPGKEELYRTGDELAAAIRNGEVDQHSRIYHRATSKWISVTLHPQYKAIVAAYRSTDQAMPPLE